ncbi:hypothetical protein BgiMline_024107 [Biomphalaria glabrata]|nr:hypothetical protein BgiMline_007318 [Biomphalaria glabrata]
MPYGVKGEKTEDVLSSFMVMMAMNRSRNANPSLSVVDPGSLAVTEDAVTEDAVTEDAVTEDAVTEDAVTEDAVTEDAVTEDAVTEDAVTEDAVTEDAVTEDAVTEDDYFFILFNINVNDYDNTEEDFV